ncbi:helix-turn-helix domain-containing protein [Martelella lutilitoris]|uniref:Helix-turn-helix domain-containing protein n=1 Tax=Martelella lutilitoris TaxID=2583532 RepID=A0A7T7HM18_9HYPH|nr:helix-turn-helix domain-containing protein [Martelella lutilitoris]QQM31704.1 helix-turn-helix domain-containing protein [Martelella lutilitoris]
MANKVREFRKSKNVTLEELADLTGISQTHLSRMESGKRGLSLANIIKIAKALGVDAVELTDEFDHEALSLASDMPEIAAPRPKGGDIENLDIISGAGGGGLLSVEYRDDGQISDPAMSNGYWSFPDNIKAGWRNLDGIKAMPVIGDSMEPTLAKGSTVFVDTSHTYPNPEDIYACDYGDGLVVKRLKLVPRSESILVISDNRERYGEPDELNRQDIRVYGRVVAWFQWRG